jgi:UDP-2,3-diacylglucosamine hydrolase
VNGPVRALFVSDVHLSRERPRAVGELRALLAGATGRVDAIYVLGDLFDEWLGDDDVNPLHAEAERALRAVTAAGGTVWVQAGNHDFLLGEAFAARTGCRLLADPTVIDLGATRAVLMHGDSLCTDDHSYQTFRRYSRDPANQRRFLALDLDERHAMAAKLRHASAELKRLKTDEIMDVSEAAVRDVLRAHRARLLIHGHTHRPAVHELRIDAAPARRIVLGDWYEAGRVALHAESEIRLLSVADAMESMRT